MWVGSYISLHNFCPPGIFSEPQVVSLNFSCHHHWVLRNVDPFAYQNLNEDTLLFPEQLSAKPSGRNEEDGKEATVAECRARKKVMTERLRSKGLGHLSGRRNPQIC